MLDTTNSTVLSAHCLGRNSTDICFICYFLDKLKSDWLQLIFAFHALDFSHQIVKLCFALICAMSFNEDRWNASDFQIRAQLEEHDISTYKFAFAPENSKENWMCDLAPYAVVGSNTIIQVADNLYHDDHADQYFLPKNRDIILRMNISGWQR